MEISNIIKQCWEKIRTIKIIKKNSPHYFIEGSSPTNDRLGNFNYVKVSVRPIYRRAMCPYCNSIIDDLSENQMHVYTSEQALFCSLCEDKYKRLVLFAKSPLDCHGDDGVFQLTEFYPFSCHCECNSCIKYEEREEPLIMHDDFAIYKLLIHYVHYFDSDVSFMTIGKGLFINGEMLLYTYLKDNHFIAFVVWEKTKIEDKEEFLLSQIWVHPDYRKQKNAKTLIDTFLKGNSIEKFGVSAPNEKSGPMFEKYFKPQLLGYYNSGM